MDARNRAIWDEINSRPSNLRPFGSALHGMAGGPIIAPPRIGRTIKPQAAGPCKVCGERRFFCEHEIAEGEEE